LIKAVREGNIDVNNTIMLNITGGGIEKFKHEHQIHYLKPSLVFPLNPDPKLVVDNVKKLF
jgi:cysteate synthase